jgi:hypothetical protein
MGRLQANLQAYNASENLFGPLEPRKSLQIPTCRAHAATPNLSSGIRIGDRDRRKIHNPFAFSSRSYVRLKADFL